MVMPQVETGVRSILRVPRVYTFFKQILSPGDGKAVVSREYIRPQVGDRILDIGCGPGDWLAVFPSVEYVGFDANPAYIESAQQQFGDRGTFICERVTTARLQEQPPFDLVLAIGILHHLDDDEALRLFELAASALKPGGRLITLDGVYVERQSPVARWIISRDRGQNVRTTDGYLRIGQEVFDRIAVNIRHDLLRIPYTHLILECTK